MLVLTVSRGGVHVTEFRAAGEKPVTLGGSDACTLVLDDASVAREHAALAFDGEAWVLTNLAGEGLAVNSEPVTQRAVRDGDILSLGAFRLVVSIQPDAAPRAEAPDAGAVAASAPEAVAQDKTVFRPRPTFAGEGPNALEIEEGPGQGLVHRFGESLRIGRAATCDLVLQDPAVSREHGLLERAAQGWQATSLNERNPLTLNGQAIRTAPVKSGDLLGAGAARLRLLLGEAPPKDAGQAKASAKAAAKPSVKAPAKAPGARFPRPDLTGLLRNRKVLLWGGGGVFGLLVLVFLFSGSEKTTGDAVLQEVRQKERAMSDSEQTRRVANLLTQGQKLADQGDLDQALARFQSVLESQPGNEQAQSAVKDLRARLDARDAQAREKEQQAAALHQKIVGLITEGDRQLAQGKYAEAAATAAKALETAPGDKEAADLLEKATRAAETARRQAEDKARQQTEARARLRDMYAKADENARAGNSYLAMKYYRDASAEDPDQARAADAKAKAAKLQDALVKQVMPDYNQGLKFYAQKKYQEALKCWLRVLEVYPEAKETNAKVAELRPVMEADAKRLYEEGLVYEGLGNRTEARRRWQEVLEIMPFQDNVYRQKAEAKLGK